MISGRNTPEAQQKWLETQRSPERRAARSEAGKRLMSDPVHLAKSHSPEANIKRSLSCRASWDNERLKKEVSERSKKMWSDPEYRKGKSEERKALWAGQSYRELKCAQVKASWADPVFREKMMASRMAGIAKRKGEMICQNQ